MDKMIDLHTHILYGIDDGSKSLDESVEIINYLYSKGYTDIVLTSHYIENSNYNSSEKTRKKLLKEIEKKLDNKDIKLYLGNEVYISHNIPELLKKHEISSINKTRYMLLEFPLNGYLNDLENILCDLNDKGIIPIIAHPERYDFLQKDPKRIHKILDFECLLQGNLGSITGRYGAKSKKVLKEFLKKDLIHIIATDTHAVSRKDYIPKASKRLEKIIGHDKYKELTYINPKKVLDNEDIIINDLIINSKK